MGLLDGRVVLVTGAGQGLGRAHAVAAAREGARLVVNDVSQDNATAVVAEIRALGGDAVANADDVTDPAGCARMVQAGLDRWGRLDGVVNNAGILRDGTFRKMDVAAWDQVLAVHLDGCFHVCRAAVPHLAERGGAIVNTTSYSGLIGNFGQSNYAAAKAGIYGFSRVLALELRRSGISVNCIAPIAKTQMTANLDMVDAAWTSDHVAPVVVYLLSDLGRAVTGKVFGVQGNRVHAYEMRVNDGVEKPGAAPWTPDELHASIDQILDMAPPKAPADADSGANDPLNQAFALLPSAFRAERAAGWAAVIHFQIKGAGDKTLTIRDGRAQVEDGRVGAPDCTVKSDAETIVGLFRRTVDPQKAFMAGRISADDLGTLMKFSSSFQFGGAPTASSPPPAPAPAAAAAAPAIPIGKVWDGGYSMVQPADIDAYARATNDVHPSYYGDDAIAPPMFHVRLMRDLIYQIATDPALELDIVRLVHGEHDATIHRPLRPFDLVQLRARLESVEDKSSGRVVTARMYGLVEGEVAVEARTVFFVRAPRKEPQPGAAQPSVAATAAEPAPAPPPDQALAIQVAADQSVRYADASLDRNPIHLDPVAARAAGLPDVILHGLCTMALAGVALCRAKGGNNPAWVKQIGVRFARPVHNGQLLSLQLREGADGFTFDVLNNEGRAVVTNGTVRFERRFA